MKAPEHLVTQVDAVSVKAIDNVVVASAVPARDTEAELRRARIIRDIFTLGIGDIA